MTDRKPHIILVVPRGEAVRNFLFSDTLPALHEQARVTLLTVVDDERFVERFRPYAEDIISLRQEHERRPVLLLRHMVHEAHYRWLWSKVAQNVWEIREEKARSVWQRFKWFYFRSWASILAGRATLERLTKLERYLTWSLRPSDRFVELFRHLQPDLVFNCSHIHGQAAELPVKIAHRMGIPTVGFIFSWDNLTSRSRIFVPYEYYLVWHDGMKRQLLSIYPEIEQSRVFVTGTPQFDFHFKPEYQLSRAELALRLGIDADRPFVFYTTGIAKHFPEEHRHVRTVAEILQSLDTQKQPQLVVRTYVKGTSPEMKALAAEGLPDVVFPDVAWDEKWYTPQYEDLAVYSSCLRHAAMGINAASTVSLELMMLDKPVMNLGFDPPGSDIPHAHRWQRHIHFDHFQPVTDSGGVMVAYSVDDMRRYIATGLLHPEVGRQERKAFIDRTFNGTLDGFSGVRVASKLLELAGTC